MTPAAPITPFTPRLTLVCRKCTREGVFPARDKAVSVRAAVKAGWAPIPGTIGEYICPRCPKPKSNAVRREETCPTIPPS
jgi:hypothetical protein